MEGQTLDIHDTLLTLLKSPMLKFDPAQYFERATLVFMQFSAMNQKVNARKVGKGNHLHTFTEDEFLFY